MQQIVCVEENSINTPLLSLGYNTSPSQQCVFNIFSPVWILIFGRARICDCPTRNPTTLVCRCCCYFCCTLQHTLPLTHRTQLTLSAIEKFSFLFQRRDHFCQAKVILWQIEQSSSKESKVKQTVTHVCVCVWQSSRRLLLMRKPVRKQGGWGLVPETRTGSEVLSEKNRTWEWGGQ